MGRRIKTVIIIAVAMTTIFIVLAGFVSCENVLLENVLKSVALPEYILTLMDDGNGSTDPSGSITVDQGLAVDISAIPDTGCRFSEWSEVSGSASFNNSLSADTTVTLNSGDATIRAEFELEDTPEINVQYDGSYITSDDTIDLGDTEIGENTDMVFTISNSGDADLTGLFVTRTGGSTLFTIQDQPSATIAPSGSDTFTLRVTPTAYGDISASFSISNNDSDENPFTFTLETSCHYEGITTLDSTGVVGKYSSICVVDQAVYISYYDETNANLKMKKSLNGGLTWSTYTVDSTGDVGQYSSITVNGSTISIAYYDATNNNGNLKLAESSNGGTNWTRTTIRNTTDDEGRFCCISENAQRFTYIKYNGSPIGNETRYCDRNGNGMWGAMGDLSLGASAAYGTRVSYGGAGYNIIYNSWSGGNDPVKYHRDRNIGVDFETDLEPLLDYPNGWPSIFSDDTTVYASYFITDHCMMADELKMARSDDNGGSFNLKKTVVSVLGAWYDDLAFSDITYEGGRLYLVFSGAIGGSGSEDLNIAISENQGSTWSVQENVSPSTGHTGLYCSIDASGAQGQYVFISFYDDATGDLKFAKSIDGGLSWD